MKMPRGEWDKMHHETKLEFLRRLLSFHASCGCPFCRVDLRNTLHRYIAERDLYKIRWQIMGEGAGGAAAAGEPTA